METIFEKSSSLGNLTIKGFFFLEEKVFSKEKEREWRHIVKVERGRLSVRARLGSQRFRKSYINHYREILIMYIVCKQKDKNQNVIFGGKL